MRRRIVPRGLWAALFFMADSFGAWSTTSRKRSATPAQGSALTGISDRNL